jgi:hypothetical protein
MPQVTSIKLGTGNLVHGWANFYCMQELSIPSLQNVTKFCVSGEVPHMPIRIEIYPWEWHYKGDSFIS